MTHDTLLMLVLVLKVVVTILQVRVPGRRVAGKAEPEDVGERICGGTRNGASMTLNHAIVGQKLFDLFATLDDIVLLLYVSN